MNNIAIIGGGNLGSAMAEGLLESGIDPKTIMVTKRNTSTLSLLADKGVAVSSDNQAAIHFADYVILAVKPFQVTAILESIKPALLEKKPTIVSLVTGLWIADIKEIIGDTLTIFRAMPNTAISIRESSTSISESNATTEKKEFVKKMFDSLGRSVFIDETLMDAATVLGACGTAFALRYIRACIQGGIEIGFNAETASLIAAQTVKGAAALLLIKKTHPEYEIDKVTTPKGCTIAGLNEMEHKGFSSSLIKGIITSYNKIVTDM